MPKKPTTPPRVFLPSILSMTEIQKLSQPEQCARFAERATVSQRAFAEMGKLHHAIASGLKKGQTIYGELRKLGVKDSTTSNASYASRIWGELVAATHLTEADYDSFTFAECLSICRAMGSKSKRQLAPEEVVIIVRARPESFDSELTSIYETGLTVEESEAQAKAEVTRREAETAEAERQRQEELQRRAEEDARRKIEEEQRPSVPSSASVPPAQSAPPVSIVSVAASAPGAPTAVSSAAPGAPPSPVEAAAPAAAPVTSVTAAATNITPMPSAPDPDSALPEWKAAVDQLTADFAAFTEPGKVEAHAYLVAALQAMIDRENTAVADAA